MVKNSIKSDFFAMSSEDFEKMHKNETQQLHIVYFQWCNCTSLLDFNLYAMIFT